MSDEDQLWLQGKWIDESRIQRALELLEAVEKLEAERKKYPASYWEACSSWPTDDDKHLKPEAEFIIHHKPVGIVKNDNVIDAIIQLSDQITKQEG